MPIDLCRLQNPMTCAETPCTSYPEFRSPPLVTGHACRSSVSQSELLISAALIRARGLSCVIIAIQTSPLTGSGFRTRFGPKWNLAPSPFSQACQPGPNHLSLTYWRFDPPPHFCDPPLVLPRLNQILNLAASALFLIFHFQAIRKLKEKGELHLLKQTA